LGRRDSAVTTRDPSLPQPRQAVCRRRGGRRPAPRLYVKAAVVGRCYMNRALAPQAVPGCSAVSGTCWWASGQTWRSAYPVRLVAARASSQDRGSIDHYGEPAARIDPSQISDLPELARRRPTRPCRRGGGLDASVPECRTSPGSVSRSHQPTRTHRFLSRSPCLGLRWDPGHLQ
jgi:hypothetical protein